MTVLYKLTIPFLAPYFTFSPRGDSDSRSKGTMEAFDERLGGRFNPEVFSGVEGMFYQNITGGAAVTGNTGLYQTCTSFVN